MRRAVAILLVATLAGCGGGAAVFGLTADDNDPAQLARVLARGSAHTGPRNAQGAPLVLAVASGSPRRLIAFDLARGAPRWAVDADVQSRVVIGGDIAVAREGQALVARGLDRGAVRWSIPLGPLGAELVGVAADRERVYAVVKTAGAKPVWRLVGLAAVSGAELWRAEAPGALGAPAAPAAHDGIVLVPYLSQWLSVLDGRTGQPLTRIRGVDAQISFVSDGGEAAMFGSAAGVLRLDARAASGKRATSSFAKAEVPAQLTRATYAADAYDPVQAGYSAAERTRILWTAGGDPFGFRGPVAVHWFRFVFGLAPGGGIAWAYRHPRADLVASAHVGAVIAAASTSGEILALDPATGAVRARVALDVGRAQLLGATFDAAGWAPTGQEADEAGGTAAALAAIARDRDARFESIKEMAVAALAARPGPEVTRELVALVQDERTPPKLQAAVADLLAARTDPTGLPVLIEALAVPSDVIDGTAPRAVAAVAAGITALGDAALEPAARQSAIAALRLQLGTPAISTRDLAAVVAALAAIGEGAERTPITQLLLIHRADPEVAGDSSLVHAMIDGLVGAGPAEREVVRLVADDGRSAPAVAVYAREALAR